MSPRPDKTSKERIDRPLPPGLRGDFLFLLALWGASTIVRWLAALPIKQPFIFPDELAFWQMAGSFFHEGRFLFFGRPYDVPTIIYPLLLSPLFAFHDSWLAHDLARGLNAALFSAAVFPAYGLARELVGRREARGVAVLSILVAGGCFSALIMTESLFYPLFTLSFWLAYRTLRDGRTKDAALAAAVLFVAFFAKPNILVLVAGYAAALAGWAIGRIARLAQRERWEGGLPRLLPLAGAAGALALRAWLRSPAGPTTLAIPADPGATAGSALATIAHHLVGAKYGYDLATPALVPDPWTVAGVALAQFITLALATGVVPLTALLIGLMRVRRSPRPLRSFLVLAGCVTAIYVVMVARHTPFVDPHRIYERYLFALSPILFAGTFSLRREAEPSARRLDVLLLIGIFVLTGPLAKLSLRIDVVSHTPSLTGALALAEALPWPLLSAFALVLAATLAVASFRSVRGASLANLAGIAAFLLALNVGWYAYLAGPHQRPTERFTTLAQRLDEHLVEGDQLTIVDRLRWRRADGVERTRYLDPRIHQFLRFWLDGPITFHAPPLRRIHGLSYSVPETRRVSGTGASYVIAPMGFESSCPLARPVEGVLDGLLIGAVILRLEGEDCELSPG